VSFLARLEGITLRHYRPQFGGMTQRFIRSAKPVTVAPENPAPIGEPALA
jgi:hypothetical protein